jgi:hypothetical protein
MENFAIPWTFIVVSFASLVQPVKMATDGPQLLTVSLGTIIALIVTISFYNFTYLSPLFNLVLNGGLSILWAMGFVMLSWSIKNSHVLARQCIGKEWGGEAEAGVCRDYKALWSMALCGT